MNMIVYKLGMSKRYYIILIIPIVYMATFICVESPAHSSSPEVISYFLDDDVMLMRDGERVYLKPGASLKAGDVIAAPSGSHADIGWADLWDCRVRENTVMTVESVDFKDMRIRLHGGDLLIRFRKKLPADSDFELLTPSANIGIRGTEFMARVRVEQKNAIASITVHRGVVEITRHSDNQTILVSAGETVEIPIVPKIARKEYKFVQRMLY